MLYFDTDRNQSDIETPLLRPLWLDMTECERLLEKEDTQFARRMFCRSAFAFIEGEIQWLKDIALHAALNRDLTHGHSVNITLASALIDDVPRVSRTGKITLEPNRVPFLNNVALVLRTLAEAIGLHAEAMFTDIGWSEMQKALAVRHRITHPKEPEELTISDEHMKSLRVALSWLFRVTEGIAEHEAERQRKSGKTSNIAPQTRTCPADGAGSV